MRKGKDRPRVIKACLYEREGIYPLCGKLSRRWESGADRRSEAHGTCVTGEREWDEVRGGEGKEVKKRDGENTYI